MAIHIVWEDSSFHKFYGRVVEGSELGKEDSEIDGAMDKGQEYEEGFPDFYFA